MTQLSLKKAAKLRSKLEELIQTLNSELYSTTARWNVLDENVFGALELAEQNFEKCYVRFSIAQMALSALRTAIGSANFRVGIADRLADISQLEQRKSVLAVITNSEPRLNTAQLDARVLTRREAVTNSSAQMVLSQEITFNILSAGLIATAKNDLAALTKHIEQLHEKIDELNTTTKIDLPADTERVATQEGLL